MSGKTWAVILVLGLAGGGYALRGKIGAAFSAEEGAAVEGASVRRGPLRIDVVERGNLKAAASVDLKSEVEGRTTILYLIEEGTEVEVGDLLCELDTSELVERRVSQEISVQNADAAYVKAKQNLEIQESQNASDVARAEREVEFAGADLRKYIEGDWPQQRREAEEAILLADEELTRAQQDLEWSEQLAAKGFLENTQLEADRLAFTRAEITLNQRKRALELLEEYEFPRRRKELEADVEEKERELQRVNLQARARLVDFEADMRTSKARLDLEQEKLAKLDSQIEKALIHAPVAGMVVYFQEPGRRWGGGEPIQEGSEIRERQGIITIPSTEGMVAEASLHESVLDRVKEGMPVVVDVDAIPDRTFRGEVKYKAVLPDQNSWWANPDLRVYRSEIRLFETDVRLRPGMSCSIEILVDELEDALYMPLQAVYLDQGRTVAFVSKGGEIEKREIEVGQNNERWVELKGGLAEGEVVLLSQPPGFSLAPAEMQDTPEGGPDGMPVPGASAAGKGAKRGETDRVPSAKAAGRSGGGGAEGGGREQRPTGGPKGVQARGEERPARADGDAAPTADDAAPTAPAKGK